ncbi:MAG: ABC transporter ATP-binding protein [Gammaproteobacteria bacterium]|nr:ABC transporter ATP-binding protein [Gammaproteobacteria bacterium]
MPRTPLLELRAISKSFPACLANDAIDLAINSGEVHALLGENGAGKSTLVKIIYGILKADSGSILWQGKETAIGNPAQARELGIAMVFQHFSLFDSLTVLENIALGMDQGTKLGQLEKQILEVSSTYGLPLDPRRHVYTLSVGERQRIEIVRCLLQQPKLLVMDEPTSVLTPQEVDKLFETLHRLADEGMAILYISHKLDEIRQLCERATILRQGRKVAEALPAGETAQSLAALMIGGDVQDVRNTSAGAAADAPVRLQVTDLSTDTEDEFGISLQHIDLQVRAGEIVGIAGVAGNGQTELLEALTGELLSGRDTVRINDAPCGDLTPAGRRKLGLCSVPEQRLGHGAVAEMSLSENSFLTAFQRLKMLSWGLIHFARRDEFTEQVINGFAVKCGGRGAFASSLSGGNLQKFIVGREISQRPDLLIVSQPTWGVDAGSAAAIHQALIELAEQGAAVLVISQDLDELMLISHRIAAICAGRLSTLYPRSQLNVQDVGLLMGGGALSADNVGEAGHA